MIRTSGSAQVASARKIVPIKDVRTFDQLREWLAGFTSETGNPNAICRQTGTPYTEVYASQICRPGDERFAESFVAADMERGIADVIDRAGCRNLKLYWRVPLETDTGIAPQVVEYRDDGPDTEFTTDKKCVMDRNWRYVKAYCRFAVGEDDGASVR